MNRYRSLRHRLAPIRRAISEARSPALKRDREDNERFDMLLAWCLRGDSSCVDVGAHSGSVLRSMVRLAPRGVHHAFEPLPSHAERIRNEFPTVSVHQVAVSDTSGEATFFHVRNNPALSGLRRRRFEESAVDCLSVTQVRLDDVLPEGYRPDLIKVDVEGGELAVLVGAERTLRSSRPIVVFEHGRFAAEYFDTGPDDVYGFLRGLGMRIFDLNGSGPYSIDAFRESFDANARWNWVAHE